MVVISVFIFPLLLFQSFALKPFPRPHCLSVLSFWVVAEMTAVITGDVVKNHTDNPLAGPTVFSLVGPLFP